MIQRPEEGEYKAYFKHYIDLVPEGSFFDLFHQNTSALLQLFGTVPAELHDYRYAQGKWSVKEMLMHLTDTERVFTYRMLVAARGDAETILYPMDENLYAARADVSARSMESLLEEFGIIRKSTELLLFNLNTEQLAFKANAANYQISARALAYITVGHATHHIQVLKERYLSTRNS